MLYEVITHWLAVRLVGTKSNLGGLGARVTVQAGEAAYSRVLDGKFDADRNNFV